MKKELILSSLLLNAPISNLSAQAIERAHSVQMEQAQELLSMQFVSPKFITRMVRAYDNDGKITMQKAKYKIVISFVPAEHYDYNKDGKYFDNEGLDYEVKFDVIKAEGYEHLEKWALLDTLGDSTYFTKKLSKNRFRLYDCDSTSTCWEDDYNRDFFIFDTPHGKLLKFSGKNKEKIELHNKSFFEVK